MSPWPAAERAAVAWAKANTPLNALLSGRVATSLPADPTLPFLTVFRVLGGVEEEIPLDTPLLQWDAWAAQGTTAQKADWGAAETLARTLVEEAFEAQNVATAHGHIYSFTIVDVARQWPSPDEPPYARFRIDTLARLRA